MGGTAGSSWRPERSQITSASETPCLLASASTSPQGSWASGRSSQRARSRASSAPSSAGPRCSSERSTALTTSSCLSLNRTTHIRPPSDPLDCRQARALNGRKGKRPATCGLRSRGMNAKRLDAVLAHRLDPDLEPVRADQIAALRQAPELAEDVAADRVVCVGVDGQLDAAVGEVAERYVPSDVPIAVGKLAQRAGQRVGLVLDLADDLLEDVLDGDDPDGPAVLIHDHGHRGTLALQLREQVVERLGLRDDQGIPDGRLDLRLWALVHHQPDEPQRVDDAAHPVGVPVLDHHQAVVARQDAEVEGVGDIRGVVDGDDGRDRGHHLTGLLLVEVEDAAQHHGLARIQLAPDRGLRDQHLEVFGARLLVEVAGSEAEQAGDAVRHPGQGDGEGRGDSPEPAQRRREKAGARLRPRDREQLGGLLPDRHVQRRHQRVGDRDRDRHRGTVREAAERRLEELRHSGLAEEPDPDGGHRDPELAGREVLIDSVELLQHARGAAGALGGELLDPRPPRAHQGELGGDEHAVDRDQDEEQDEEDSGHRRCPDSAWAWPAAVAPRWARVLRGRSSSVTGDGRRLADVQASFSTLLASSKSFSVIPPSEWVEIATSTWLQEMAMSGWWPISSAGPTIESTNSTDPLKSSRSKLLTMYSPRCRQPSRPLRPCLISSSLRSAIFVGCESRAWSRPRPRCYSPSVSESKSSPSPTSATTRARQRASVT